MGFGHIGVGVDDVSDILYGVVVEVSTMSCFDEFFIYFLVVDVAIRIKKVLHEADDVII